MEMKNGFFTALGTPLDDFGMIDEASLRKEIELQIEAGVSGLLLMGTMGMLGCIPDRAYEPCVRIACDQVAGRVPLLVGATDNSLARVKDKLSILKQYPAFPTLMPPYYFKMRDEKLIPFFRTCPEMFTGPIFLYDHLPITKHKLNLEQVKELALIPNIAGIKSADIEMIRQLHICGVEEKCDFTPIISDISFFAEAFGEGITHYLDGLFSCIPNSICAAQKLLNDGDIPAAKQVFGRMIAFRDELIAIDLWPAFRYAMNLLGCSGNYAPDYEGELSAPDRERVKDLMRGMGELA